MDLTVAICMYNAAKYVEETLECLMNQTRQDFKLLIVNDCSTDNSASLVEQFFEKHPRQYELINLPQNGGLATGRRYVEEHTSTKYLLFVDADDCPLPKFVERLYETISSDKDLIAVGCHLSYINSESTKISGGMYLGATTKEEFRKKAEAGKFIFMVSASIYDRDVALSVGGHNIEGFPEGKPRYQDYCEDLDLWTRMSDFYKDGKALIVIPEILYHYRKHEQAMSTNSIGMALRMRHIKTNVKRRRKGEKDRTFVEFMEWLPKEEYAKIVKEAKASDAFRNCFYSLRKGKLIAGVKNLYICLKNRPGYIFDKIKHNLLRIK